MNSAKKQKPIITFVGIKQAKKGLEFLHRQLNLECKRCEYYSICIGKLGVGRVYKIVGLRDNVFPCLIHESGVRVVEVVESEIYSAVPVKIALEGAIIKFQSEDCAISKCRNYVLCKPIGLFNGDRCQIVKVYEKINCQRKLDLVKVMLKRLPAT